MFHHLSLRLVILWAAIISIPAFTCHPLTSQGQELADQHSDHRVFPDLYEASISELQVRQYSYILYHVNLRLSQDGLEAGHFTSVDLVKVLDPPLILSILSKTKRNPRRTLLVSTR